MDSASKRRPRKPPTPSEDSATEQGSVGLKKRPWLLALAAGLVALWVGFLAVMAFWE